MSTVAENTKQIIKNKGFKQKAIAKKAGYPEQVFNNMLNGRRQITDVDIVKIINALDVTPNQLFAKETPKQES